MAEVLDDIYSFDGIFPTGDLDDDARATLKVIQRHYTDGHTFAKRLYLEDAIRSFAKAFNECSYLSSNSDLAKYHSCRSLGCIGNANRRLGRYEEAAISLKTALKDVQFRPTEAYLRCELAGVYMNTGSFEDAHREAQLSCDLASAPGLDMAACRTKGIQAVIWYYEYTMDKDPVKLKRAAQDLESTAVFAERLARDINIDTTSVANDVRFKYDLITTYRTHALSRLSACYTALGNPEKALEVAQQAWEMASTAGSIIAVAHTRFFYGRALLNIGQIEAARSHLDPAEAGLTPVLSFCGEPSNQYNMCLQECVDFGVNLERTDDHGYTALELAIFSGNQVAVEIVRAGLRKSLHGYPGKEARLERYEAEARIRKAYREIFQYQLRPIFMENSPVHMVERSTRALLQSGEDYSFRHRPRTSSLMRGSGFRSLRRRYLQALIREEEYRKLFDPLLLVSYEEFVGQGEIRRSNSDCEVRAYQEQDGLEEEYVIFLSYARLRKGAAREDSPDDVNNTIFKRMVAAVEGFLDLHSEIERKTLKIWVDHASVPLANPQPGINALPIIVAQCDAVISLVDDTYYTRAWCSVEVLMAQTLAKAYGLLEWWEQVPQVTSFFEEEQDIDSQDGKIAGKQGREVKAGGWTLRKGDLGMKIEVKGKNLSYEEDRPRVLFLERQSRLLG